MRRLSCGARASRGQAARDVGGAPADRRHAGHRHARCSPDTSTGSPACGSRGRGATKPGAGRIRAGGRSSPPSDGCATSRCCRWSPTSPYNTLNALGVLFGARAHVSGLPAVWRRLRRLRADQPGAAPLCGRRAVDGTALLDALPALSGARGGRPAAQRPAWVGRLSGSDRGCAPPCSSPGASCSDRAFRRALRLSRQACRRASSA